MSAIRRKLRTARFHRRSFRQRGFALVSAIFLLVVLTVLGAFMLTLSTVQHATANQDLQGSRALQGARAGIEWGIYQAMIPESTNMPTGGSPYVCPAGPSSISSLGGSLIGFNVQVQCTMATYTEGDHQIGVYHFTSTSSSGTSGTAQYVERKMSASMSTCRTNGVPCND
ncbi:hypothetical protein HAV38_03235 [Glaciimonas immobilis]|nr:hypothetical protein HAV38_03235 [Glaciimonas immobilis]